MKKLAIIVDPFSYADQTWTEKHQDFYFLALQLELDQQNYKIGASNSPNYDQLSIKISKAREIKTSMPTPRDTLNLYQKLTQEYEHVIHLPIGSAVSGTAKAATIFAKDFSNIHVLDNYLVGQNFIRLAHKLLAMARENVAFEKIWKYAQKYVTDPQTITYIIPKNISTFVKSGRLGSSIGILLDKIKVIPVVAYKNTEKLQKVMIRRTWKKAMTHASQKIIDLFKSLKDKYDLVIIHGIDQEVKNFVTQFFDQQKIKYSLEKASPLALAATGSEAISMAIMPKQK